MTEVLARMVENAGENDFQDPYEACKCTHCGNLYFFKDLETSGGTCDSCIFKAEE